jgi:hypothetical protein
MIGNAKPTARALPRVPTLDIVIQLTLAKQNCDDAIVPKKMTVV